jgi:hypothetical protein
LALPARRPSRRCCGRTTHSPNYSSITTRHATADAVPRGPCMPMCRAGGACGCLRLQVGDEGAKALAASLESGNRSLQKIKDPPPPPSSNPTPTPHPAASRLRTMVVLCALACGALADADHRIVNAKPSLTVGLVWFTLWRSKRIGSATTAPVTSCACSGSTDQSAAEEAPLASR